MAGALTHGPPHLTSQVAERMLHKEAFSVATLETMNDANIRTSPSLDLSTLAAATLCTQAAIPHNLPCNPMHPGTNLSLLRPLRANHLGEIDVFDDYPVPTDQRMWDGLCRRTVTPPACRPTSATAHCPAPLRMEPSPYHLPTVSLPSPYHLPAPGGATHSGRVGGPEPPEGRSRLRRCREARPKSDCAGKQTTLTKPNPNPNPNPNPGAACAAPTAALS